MTSSRHGALLGAAILVSLIAAAPIARAAQPPACRPTVADFRSLRLGMSYAQSVAHLGCPGRKVTDLAIGHNHRAIYSWRGRGSYGANLNLTFRNGRLTDRSQLGLR